MTETFRVGSSVQDLCRVCKMVRRHTVVAAGGDVIRLHCDYCGSQHNYRGGERSHPAPAYPAPPRAVPAASAVATSSERSAMSSETGDLPGTSLESLLRRIIREEAGLTPVDISPKWLGGELVLRPGRPGLQEKNWPLETFLHKIVMIRNRLRNLEQQVNASELPADVKLKLQSHITGCYGSLTSFNVLFADDEDRFHGTSGGGGD